MNSGFSGVLKLTDLDDFITPSQDCIKPIEIKKEVSTTGAKIRVEDDGSYVQVSEDGEKTKLARVDISLADCLACSGCITTAETVLINQQSHHEVLRVLNNKSKEGYKLIVVSLSLQPVLSLAAQYSISPEECLSKLSGLFKRLGADIVLDTSFADDVVLLEEAKEFFERFEKHKNGDNSVLPMLSSSCPGWVCYSEKTRPAVLPLLSRVRSAQQLIGAAVKGSLASEKALVPREIFHVAVMPCYDKKLEASRDEFATNGTKDVDCVITPVEIGQLIEECCLEGLQCEMAMTPDWPWSSSRDAILPLSRPAGSGSGGLAHHVVAVAASSISYEGQIVFKQAKKSNDFQEVTIEVGETIFKAAIVTGFKNIQNLVNRIKRGKCDYHYVEVMACPMGCLNGGAQMKGMFKNVESLYEALQIRNPSAVESLYQSMFPNVATLKTTFQPVTFNPNPLSIKW